jgi:zinc transport system substrate-binding protein
MTVMNDRCPGPIRTPGPPCVPARVPARTRVRALAATVALGTLGTGALTGCSVFSAQGDAAPLSGKGGRLAVVASFYPMQFLAERIGGDRVRVTSLTEPGQEPHDLEISARQTAQLEKSDIALYLGGVQPSVDEAIRQSAVGTKVDAAALTSPGEHGGAATDPHIWLDPVRYAQVAKGVGKAFAKADPDHAAGYRRNTDALVERLDALDTRYTRALHSTSRKVFITTHAAFGRLAERYGLTQEAISGLSPESEPSPTRIRDLQRTAKADGVTTVFYETLVSDRTAKTLAGDAHLRTDVLDPIEGITGASRGDDYIEVMDANLTALQRALGSPAPPNQSNQPNQPDDGEAGGADGSGGSGRTDAR